jgi:Na+/phosphate symporter
VTLARLVVVVLLVLSGVLAFYGLVLDRSGQNITFTVIGLLLFGLCLIFVASWLLGRALTDARHGRTGGALLGGVAGGLCAIGAAMSLAAASVYAIITGL